MLTHRDFIRDAATIYIVIEKLDADGWCSLRFSSDLVFEYWNGTSWETAEMNNNE